MVLQVSEWTVISRLRLPSALNVKHVIEKAEYTAKYTNPGGGSKGSAFVRIAISNDGGATWSYYPSSTGQGVQYNSYQRYEHEINYDGGFCNALVVEFQGRVQDDDSDSDATTLYTKDRWIYRVSKQRVEAV